MRIVCWQTILLKYHALFFWKQGKMSQNLPSVAVVVGALRVKIQIKLPNSGNFLSVVFWRSLNRKYTAVGSLDSDKPGHLPTLTGNFVVHLSNWKGLIWRFMRRWRVSSDLVHETRLFWVFVGSMWILFWLARPLDKCSYFSSETLCCGYSQEPENAGLQLRVRNENLIFLFISQNICCGYSEEPS